MLLLEAYFGGNLVFLIILCAARGAVNLNRCKIGRSISCVGGRRALLQGRGAI